MLGCLLALIHLDLLHGWLWMWPGMWPAKDFCNFSYPIWGSKRLTTQPRSVILKICMHEIHLGFLIKQILRFQTWRFQSNRSVVGPETGTVDELKAICTYLHLARDCLRRGKFVILWNCHKGYLLVGCFLNQFWFFFFNLKRISIYLEKTTIMRYFGIFKQ